MGNTSSRSIILIVDDAPENLQILGELLQPSYTVKVAVSGERGLRIAVSSPRPDLILLDVMMPEMDGYECLRRLRADPRSRDIPVIFVTALDSTEDERLGLDLGAVDYITKPIRPAVVEARVRNHLEMKATRDWLREQNSFLEAELARLLEVLAHHLQEPVRRQFTFAQMLKRSLPSPLNDRAEMSLAQIMEGAARLRALLHDVVLYLAACQAPAPTSPCDAGEAFAEVRRLFAADFGRIGAEVNGGRLPAVLIARDQLVAVFRALLGNAFEYRAPHRPLRVRVDAAADGAEALFSVSDNGIGIAPEFRERVFWVFERLHAGTDLPGTGIGLALVKKIIETARGRVWAEDGDDGGVKICFTLPHHVV